MQEEPFRILVVCTANLCRSPMVEFQLRAALKELHGLSENSGYVVSSAGTLSSAGHPMHPRAAQILAERGLIQLEDFRSRRVDAAQIAQADLILTAAREHRGAIAQLVPAAGRITFTLLQAARLARAANEAHPAGGEPVPLGALLMQRLTLGRTLVQPMHPSAENLKDPIGRRLGAFRTCSDLIQHSVLDLIGDADESRQGDRRPPAGR